MIKKPEYDENIKLKPCPFCGSDEVEIFTRDYRAESETDNDVLIGYGFSEVGIELKYAQNQTH